MTRDDKGGGGGLGKDDIWQWQEGGRQQENYVNLKIELGGGREL